MAAELKCLEKCGVLATTKEDRKVMKKKIPSHSFVVGKKQHESDEADENVQCINFMRIFFFHNFNFLFFCTCCNCRVSFLWLEIFSFVLKSSKTIFNCSSLKNKMSPLIKMSPPPRPRALLFEKAWSPKFYLSLKKATLGYSKGEPWYHFLSEKPWF